MGRKVPEKGWITTRERRINVNFGEKKAEYSQKHGKDIPVWQSPKYLESKAKAEEII